MLFFKTKEEWHHRWFRDKGCLQNGFFVVVVVVQVQLSLFLPHQGTLPHTTPPLTLKPISFSFGHVSFIHVPWWTFPYFLPLSLSPLPSGYCQFVLYFNVSGYILLTSLFGWLGSIIVEIIWYFSFTTWLVSLSIMLSSCIYTVENGRNSSFFLMHSIPFCKCTMVFLSTHLQGSI